MDQVVSDIFGCFFGYCDIMKDGKLKEDFGNIPRRNDPKWLNIPGNTVPVNQIGVKSRKNTNIVPSQQVVSSNNGGWAAKHLEPILWFYDSIP